MPRRSFVWNRFFKSKLRLQFPNRNWDWKFKFKLKSSSSNKSLVLIVLSQKSNLINGILRNNNTHNIIPDKFHTSDWNIWRQIYYDCNFIFFFSLLHLAFHLLHMWCVRKLNKKRKKKHSKQFTIWFTLSHSFYYTVWMLTHSIS